MKIRDVEPNATATLDYVTVVKKEAVREFEKFGKKGLVCNCTIKDASGEMQLTLWNEDVNAVEEGEKIKITDGWVKEWNGQKQITPGRNGKIEKL
jgi:replication factor A1